MRVPLYSISAGQLGSDAPSVDEEFRSVFDLARKWNAVLLLDEADVFLEQRSLQDLQRNQFVSVFLRMLEYYEGVLFLTTNRIHAFDPAFHSRIHVTVEYKELDEHARRKVWRNFLDASMSEHALTDRDVEVLAKKQLNGRQIRNLIKASKLVAKRQKAVLSLEHVEMVLQVT
jgi:SpoVK/Ycf46/Vps4 family AAA+-type ATPase